MQTKTKLITLALLLALLGTFLMPTVGVAAQSGVTVPITGTTDTGDTFTGTLDITRFRVQNGVLTAIGSLSGTLTDALGTVIGTVTNIPLSLPVADISGTCDILHLELGPLDLDLLGLVVHLDQVVLDIDAEQGPGNLLGNLLCAVAGLLDNGGNGALRGITQLLNQILGILG